MATRQAGAALVTAGTYATSTVTVDKWGRVTAITAGPKITVGTTAPTSPAAGDIWVDTN